MAPKKYFYIILPFVLMQGYLHATPYYQTNLEERLTLRHGMSGLDEIAETVDLVDLSHLKTTEASDFKREIKEFLCFGECSTDKQWKETIPPLKDSAEGPRFMVKKEAANQAGLNQYFRTFISLVRKNIDLTADILETLRAPVVAEKAIPDHIKNIHIPTLYALLELTKQLYVSNNCSHFNYDLFLNKIRKTLPAIKIFHSNSYLSSLINKTKHLLTLVENSKKTLTITLNKTPVLSLSDLEKVGEKPGGSVPGDLYKNKKTQEKYIVKYTKTPISKNELLAYRFYKAAGVFVPDFALVQQQKKGEFYLGVKYIDELKRINWKNGAQKGILDSFIIDAWLGNYDVFGYNYDSHIDNIFEKDGKPCRIDIGASLEYKAMGGEKKEGFNDQVNEVWFFLSEDLGKGETILKNLFSKCSNTHKTIMKLARSIFRKLSKENIQNGYQKLQIMTDDTIEAIVSVVLQGESEKNRRDHLIKLLKTRRDRLINIKEEILSELNLI